MKDLLACLLTGCTLTVGVYSATVAGRVTDSGVPVVGTLVEVRKCNSDPLRSDTSDASGRYRVTVVGFKERPVCLRVSALGVTSDSMLVTLRGQPDVLIVSIER